MRRISISVFTLASLFLLGAMAAWACTNLATLNLSESAVSPGQSIDITGSSFSTAEKGGQAVQIHWNAANGPVLASVNPDPTGNVAAVKIPADAKPGYYVLVATQAEKGDDGKVSAAYGTPARASVVIGSVAPIEAAEPAAAPAAVAAEPSSTGMMALTALLALLGIGLFGAGLSLFVRDVRRRAVPAPVQRRDTK